MPSINGNTGISSSGTVHGQFKDYKDKFHPTQSGKPNRDISEAKALKKEAPNPQQTQPALISSPPVINHDLQQILNDR